MQRDPLVEIERQGLLGAGGSEAGTQLPPTEDPRDLEIESGGGVDLGVVGEQMVRDEARLGRPQEQFEHGRGVDDDQRGSPRSRSSRTASLASIEATDSIESGRS